MIRRTRGTYSSTALDPEEYFGENYDIPAYEEYEEEAYGTLNTIYPELSDKDIQKMVEYYMEHYANENYEPISEWEWDKEKEKYYEEVFGEKLS